MKKSTWWVVLALGIVLALLLGGCAGDAVDEAAPHTSEEEDANEDVAQDGVEDATPGDDGAADDAAEADDGNEDSEEEVQQDEGIVLLRDSESVRCRVTKYPERGDTSMNYIEGMLECDAPEEYKIVTLIRVGSIYGPKPLDKDPYAFVASTGHFQAEFVTEGEDADYDCTEIYLYILPRDYEHEIEWGEDNVVLSRSTAKLLEDSVCTLRIER